MLLHMMNSMLSFSQLLFFLKVAQLSILPAEMYFINSKLNPMCYLSQKLLLFVTFNAVIVQICIVILHNICVFLVVYDYTCLYYFNYKIVHECISVYKCINGEKQRQTLEELVLSIGHK